MRSKLLPLLVLAVAAAYVMWQWRGAVSGSLESAVAYVHAMGPLGVAAFILLYVAVTVAALPAAIVTLAAGLFYGPYWGALLVLVASLLGAVIAFLLARSWLRPTIEKRYGEGPIYSYFAKETEREGAKLVLLLRLSPLIHFSLLNYTLGLTRVPLLHYSVASAFGMVPGILLYAHAGASLSNPGDVPGWLFWVGLAATLVATIILGRLSARAIRLGREGAA